MDFPSVIFWVLMVIGLRSRGPLMLYIFFGLLPFETTAVVPPALVGGVTFTPGWMAMAFLTLKVILLQPSLSDALAPLTDLRRIGLLAACTVYGVVSAFFFPRLFEGAIDVFAMRAELQVAIPLQPSSANITQTFYFVMTTLGVLSFYLVARTPQLKPHLFNALLFGGAVTALAGVVDITTYTLGLGALLEPFRTATYAFLVDSEVLGAKRVVGLSSEASAYAGLCMSFATPIFFLRQSFQTARTRNLIAPATFLVLVVMIALSTSSTGYVGMAVLGAVLVAYGLREASRGRAAGWQSLILVYAAAALILSIVVFKADILQKGVEMVDEMVFHKTQSSSYIERSSWNRVTFQAFLDTFGLGAGLGSARASSWVVSILGNIGAVGAGLMLGFLCLVYFSRPPNNQLRDAETATGAKAALIPMLVMASLSGTSVGFGLIPAFLFGLIGAVSWPSKSRHTGPAKPLARPRLAAYMAPRTRF